MDTQTNLAQYLGLRLKRARKAVGLSQEEVASKLGITRAALSHIERGATLMTVEHLVKLPDVLNKPITYFLPKDVVSEEELHDPLLLDPYFKAIVAAWPEAPEYLKEHVSEMLRRSVEEG